MITTVLSAGDIFKSVSKRSFFFLGWGFLAVGSIILGCIIVLLTVFAFGDFNFFFNVFLGGLGVFFLGGLGVFFLGVFFFVILFLGGLGVFSTKINFFFVCFFFTFRTLSIIYIKIIKSIFF